MNNINPKNMDFEERFDNQTKFNSNWVDDSYKSPRSYRLENGNLKITTSPETTYRVKVKTKRNDFGLGIYNWQVYIPLYSLNDQCSIGAFLYHNGEDEYELDFEIGSGSKAHRAELNAKPNEAIVHCTSQIKPFNTERFLIETEKWHDLKLELTKGDNSNYLVKWYINNKLVKTLQTNFKSDISFSIHNSLENLNFMGNQLPSKENYTLFKNFTFKSRK